MIKKSIISGYKMGTLSIISVVIGFIAIFMASVTMLPQLIKTWKTKLTVNLSLKTLLIFNLANTLWIVFAIIHISIPQLFTSKGNITSDILWSLILFIPYAITWIITTIIIAFKIFNMIKYHESGGNLKNIKEAEVHRILNIPEDTDAGHSKLKPHIVKKKNGI